MSSRDSRALARLMHQVGPAYARWAQHAIPVDGLSPARLQVLAHLRDAPAPLHAIRDCLGSSAANVTKLVDALEADGFVVRVPDPNDRRVIQVEITEAGQRASCGAWDVYEGNAAKIFDHLTEKERDDLAHGLSALNDALQSTAHRVR